MPTIEQAMDVAIMVVKNGGSTPVADRTFSNMLKGTGQEGAALVWRLDHVVASREGKGVSSTLARPIATIGLHLVRASAAVDLGKRMAAEGTHEIDLDAEIRRIQSLPSPHKPGTLMLAAAGAAVFFALLTGGDPGAAGIACAAALVGQSVRGILQTRGLARVGVTAICALLSGLIAAVGLRLGLSQTAPAAFVGAVVYMVPGVMLINGCIDVVSPRHMSVGVERLLDAGVILFTLTVAVILANGVLTGFSMGAM